MKRGNTRNKNTVVLYFLCFGILLHLIYPTKANLTSKEALWENLLKNYSKAEPPTQGLSNSYSTEVKLGIYVNSFFSISEASMDYSISFYLRQQWNDPRLKFDPIDGVVNEVKLPDASWDRIWVPDVFFRNEKKASYHAVTTHNRLLRLKSNGDLWYVSKITATLACPMVLKRYPMDTQSCPIKFESFGYTSDTMHFTWLEAPAEVDPDNEIPQFSLTDIVRSDCSQNYTGGSFSCLELQFILQRDTGFFVLQVYIPSMLVVILSWVNFWINAEAVPARVSIGLITVLTMTTHSSSANSNLPKVSYVKAIDVWMSMCLLFVFAALLEYAFVNVMSRGKGKSLPNNNTAPSSPSPLIHKTPIHMNKVAEANESGDENNHRGVAGWSRFRRSFSNHFYNPEERYSDRRKQARMRALMVDKSSRIIFPVIFLIFNTIYWAMFYSKPSV